MATIDFNGLDTAVRITPAGRKALLHYLDQMQAVIDSVRGGK